MPRIHIQMQVIDEIEELEDWEQRLGLPGASERRAARQASDRRTVRGSIEALDRKRAERRKQVFRGGKRA